MIKPNRVEEIPTITFVVPGIPVSRHQPGRNRHTGATFKNKQDDIWQNHVRTYAILNRPRVIPDYPVELTVIFKFPKPLYHKQGLEYYHTRKPDLDNLVKLVKDALTKSLYVDDAQVCCEKLYKIYDDKPGLIIEVKYLPHCLMGKHKIK